MLTLNIFPAQQNIFHWPLTHGRQCGVLSAGGLLHEQLVLGSLHLGQLLDVEPPVEAELRDVGVAHLGRDLSLLL